MDNGKGGAMGTATDGAADGATDDGVDALAGLALDLRWSWEHSGDELWAAIDPGLWAATHNPLVVLQTASQARPRDQERAYFDTKGWLPSRHAGAPLQCVVQRPGPAPSTSESACSKAVRPAGLSPRRAQPAR